MLAWEGIGSIAAGHNADLAIIDRNPLTCDIEHLPDTTVIATFLGGRLVGGERLGTRSQSTGVGS